MPLGVITVDYGKQESIFEKLNPFVDKLVNIYNNKKMQEWDSEWMTMALKDIDKASNQESIDALFAKQNPPEGWIDTEGMTNFAQEAIGMINMTSQPAEDLMKNNLPALSTVAEGIPKTGLAINPKPKETPETQLMPDKMEWNELYKFVSELPTGQVDWSNTLGVFQQRLESKKKMGDAAKQFLNQILGQGVTDQRAKFEQDFNLTSDIMQTLYPETEQVDPIAQAWDRAAKLPQDMRADFLRQNGIDIPEGDKLDYDSLNAFMKDNNMKVKTSTVNDKGGQSFTLEPIEDEYDLNDIVSMIKEAEQAGIDLRYTKDGFTMSTASETSGKPSSDYERWLADPEGFKEYKEVMAEIGGSTETQKLTPTYATIQSINEDLLDPTKDYDRVLAQAGVKYDLSDPNINFATKADRARGIYDFALTGDDKTYGILDTDIVDEDGFVKDEAEYNFLYQEYEKAAKEYYEATGVMLPKDFLSPEEAGRYTGLTIGKGYKGGLKPVKNPGNIPWSWEGNINKSKTAAFIHDAKASGYTLANYDIEELKKAGVDIEKARQALGN